MITKNVSSATEALSGITDGMTLMLGGFGLCGRCGWELKISHVSPIMPEWMILDWDSSFRTGRSKK